MIGFGGHWGNTDNSGRSSRLGLLRLAGRSVDGEGEVASRVLLIFYGAWIAITAVKQDWMVGHISEIDYLQVKYKFSGGRMFACS